MNTHLSARLGPALPRPSAVAHGAAAVRLLGSGMPMPADLGLGAGVISARLGPSLPWPSAAAHGAAAVRLPGSGMPTPADLGLGAGVMSARLGPPALPQSSAADLDPSAVAMTGEVSLDPRTGGARLVTAPARCARPPEPALTRRGFPGPAAATPLPMSPHRSTRMNPVPSPAHSTSRAIRVRRSPR
ncbi:hypothetical protein [Streptomyces sp. GQFP]|uniref:hypothetical protein n=1 Tax=Streptomyces sp. GQFP TaxID=2907545 RepID=UPI001F381535|nr:hypothetical protein [Streptomyces sp. GQFP]UIX33383.1 hypothetical protein LUX31_27115 [Streptomyces sp. GQFP]